MMMKRMIGLVFLLAVASGWAANDWGFNFQAELLDKNGNVFVDEKGKIVHRHIVELRIYDSKEGGSALWARSYPVRSDNSGQFNLFVTDAVGTQLDGVTADLKTVFMTHRAGALFIGLKVQGRDAELKPRQRLCGVPFASLALTAYDLRGNGVTTTNGSLYVSGQIKVNKTGSITAGSCQEGTITGGSLRKNCIIIWPCSNAPDGKPWESQNGGSVSSDGQWAICDGNNGTPNLVGKFPVSYGSDYSCGASGGSSSVTLTQTTIPSHYHLYAADMQTKDLKPEKNCGSVTHPYTNVYIQIHKPVEHSGYEKSDVIFCVFNSTDGSHTTKGQAHENMPPYRALYYIMRLK